MSPVATLPVQPREHTNGKQDVNGNVTKSNNTTPLRKTGVLDDAFKFEETTPVIGMEYPNTNIVNDLLNATNADELLRDLAITSKFNDRGFNTVFCATLQD